MKLHNPPLFIFTDDGGGEMVAILPETNHAGAMQVAHEVLGRVRHLRIAHEGRSDAECILTVQALRADAEPRYTVETG